MFPAASPAEARHCLAVAGGDIAKAAQLALHRQEAGQSIVSNLTFLTVSIYIYNMFFRRYSVQLKYFTIKCNAGNSYRQSRTVLTYRGTRVCSFMVAKSLKLNNNELNDIK